MIGQPEIHEEGDRSLDISTPIGGEILRFDLA
jgi:hypothetical protein